MCLYKINNTKYSVGLCYVSCHINSEEGGIICQKVLHIFYVMSVFFLKINVLKIIIYLKNMFFLFLFHYITDIFIVIRMIL